MSVTESITRLHEALGPERYEVQDSDGHSWGNRYTLDAARTLAEDNVEDFHRVMLIVDFYEGDVLEVVGAPFELDRIEEGL